MASYYSNRTTANQLGSFFTTLTEFDFNDKVNGHTFIGRLASEDPNNPGPPSTGDTDISAISGDGPYLVTGDLTIFAELSVDGSPFTAGPMRDASIESTAVPEPSSLLLLLTGAAGVFLVARLRRLKS